MRLARDQVYSNGVALVLNSVVSSVLGFVFWVMLARIAPSQALGWGAAVVSAATLAALIGKAGFDAAIIRYAPGADRSLAVKLLAQGTLAAVLLTAAVVGVILALAGEGVPSLAPLRSPVAAIGFLLLACGTSGAWILDAFFIAEQSAIYTLARNVAFSLAKLVVPLAVIGSFFIVPIAWAAGLAVSVLVALAFLPRVLRARPEEPVPRPARREVVGYAAKNYVLNLAEFLPGLVLPILVLDMLGADANARFYVAWTLATVGFLASKAIAQSAFSALVRAGPAREPLVKAALLSGIALAPFAFALLFLPHEILRVFGAAYATDGAPLLRLLAFSLPPLVATNLYLAYLKARRPGWELTLLPGATLVALLAALPLALAFAGTRGAALAWLAVQTASGLYALARLAPILFGSETHVPRQAARLGRHPHQG